MSARNINNRFRYALSRSRGIPIETDLAPYLRTVEEVRITRRALASVHDLGTVGRRIATEARHLLETAAGSGCGVSGPRESAELPPELLVEALAIASEAAGRELGLEPFDEQLVASLAMYRGRLVEMQTGEGKTLAAAFTATLRAFAGAGVHLLTANDYLAGRDAEWMAPIYRAFGLETASVSPDMSEPEKRAAYGADVTFLTAKQAGFDFLVDGLRFDPDARVQRPFASCLVDEADFILIDEARVPLVVARESESPYTDPVRIDEVARSLIVGEHASIDRAAQICVLTVEGQQRVEELLGCGGTDVDEALPVYAAVNVALHAHHLLTRDVDYIVRDRRIELVDEFTGRVAENRKWPFGIHTALEVKERLNPERHGGVCASITVQHLIGLYPFVAAMTATAVSAAEELFAFYRLSTVVIPPHVPNRMVRLDDLVYETLAAKREALVEEITGIHVTGRPILVGTRSVRESNELSALLDSTGLPHRVLNAACDSEEAMIIAEAGAVGAVTISTNMAGRGTDIRLGGSDGGERDRVATLGGLCVIGTNRHESLRIDRQLLGRAARQGDPGSGRFFVSLEDDLITRYAITEFIPAEYLARSGDGLDQGGGEAARRSPIVDRRIAKEIDRAQEIIEGRHFQMRRTLRKYSEIIEKQRALLSSLRWDSLEAGVFPESLLIRLTPILETLPDDRLDEAADIAALVFAERLDAFWVEHLAWVETVREAIHLRRYGGRDPLLAFLEDATRAFDDGFEQTITATVAAVARLIDDPDSARSIARAIRSPASTWTYTTSDNPFPSFRVALLTAGVGIGAAAAIMTSVFAPFVLVGGIVAGIIARVRRKIGHASPDSPIQ